VRAKKIAARAPTMTTVATPIAAAAEGNPISAIANTQSGEKISPAKLAPL
jgi:hypothetical protein